MEHPETQAHYPEKELIPAKKQQKKRPMWVSLIRPAVLLLVAVFLTTYVSFSWMRREWTPYVEQSGISIATSGSLVFQLEGDGASGGTGMSIVDILKLSKDFVLKPVSNQNGGSDGFFTMDMRGGEGSEKYEYLDVSKYNKDYSAMGVDNGYIEFQMMLFSLISDNSFRYVYIHPDSYVSVSSETEDIQKDVINCIRISVTIVGTGQTFIFVPEGCPVEHSGVNEALSNTSNVFYYEQPYDKSNPQVADKLSDGTLIVAEANPNACRVTNFSSVDGGTYAENGVLTEFDPAESLFYFEADESESGQQWITIRVWAEGSHEDCKEAIAGAKIDLKLKFASHTVETASN